MTANIMDNDKVIVVGDPAWHKLGQNFTEPISGIAAYEAMGGGYELECRPLGVMFNDTFIAVPDQFAIVRGPTNKDAESHVFGYVTDHYHIIQPLELIQKFDEKVGVSIETLGFIGLGEKMFVTWNLPQFEVKPGDVVKLYGTLLLGFDNIFSSRLNIAAVRTLCWNTFSRALQEAKEEKKKNRGRGTIYQSKHTNPALLNEIGEWMGYIQDNANRQVELCQSLFRTLAATPIIHDQQAKDLIADTWANPAPVPDFWPDTLREKQQAKVDTEAEKAEKIRNGIYNLYSTPAGIGIDATSWGLFNACTQYFNHVMPSKKDTEFSTVWGNRSNEMNRFAEVLRTDALSR